MNLKKSSNVKKDTTPDNKYFFEPQKDITAYELAYVLSHVCFNPLSSLSQTGVIIRHELWADVPMGVKRHFRKHVE
jgi:hypothetical protein